LYQKKLRQVSGTFCFYLTRPRLCYTQFPPGHRTNTIPLSPTYLYNYDRYSKSHNWPPRLSDGDRPRVQETEESCPSGPPIISVSHCYNNQAERAERRRGVAVDGFSVPPLRTPASIRHSPRPSHHGLLPVLPCLCRQATTAATTLPAPARRTPLSSPHTYTPTTKTKKLISECRAKILVR